MSLWVLVGGAFWALAITQTWLAVFGAVWKRDQQRRDESTRRREALRVLDAQRVEQVAGWGL